MDRLAARFMDGIQARADKDAGEEVLDLLRNPFGEQLQSTSVLAAFGYAVATTLGLGLAFSLLRPYNQVVYAPKLKHADERHAPPPIGRKVWSWVLPLWNTSEYEFIQVAGMDAAIFLRFIIMLRNMFIVLSIICVAILVPVNMFLAADIPGDPLDWLPRLTPMHVFGATTWAYVVVGYLINFTVMFFLWWNTKKVLHLRRRYFESEEYQHSLHARTLMLYDIPKDRCSDEGIARIIDGVVPNSSFARTAISRNVKDLPEIIEQHDKTVRKLESVLAKYLKNPSNLPPERPTCKPSKKDPSYDTYPKGQKVDAIDYLTQRIRILEVEIKEVRLNVDKRSSKPYGFASYADISEAHNIAYASRKKHPDGATIKLAPRPNDIIWKNMVLDKKTRNWRRFINNLWIALLTLVWIVPNAGIAIFLVNLSNLGRVWEDFDNTMKENEQLWGIIQGIAAPTIMSLVFLVLPIIFRRLSIKAGDQTKTGRERHVVAKLYSFFVFNNLVVFSFFSALWTYGVNVKGSIDKGADPWDALKNGQLDDTLFLALISVSPFWVSWILQRQLGAAIDLTQLWPLFYSFFVRRFSSPTPRELIELTAPPVFNYAPYYNYFLYYTTIGLCFACIQPLIVPALAMYFAIDLWMKKYLLLYVFVTKTESGGLFWRILFNRCVFATMLGNLVLCLMTFCRGDRYNQVLCSVPLPFLMLIFKFVCARQFDDKIRYYSTLNVAKHPENGVQKEQRLRSERLASRFGHPALYKPLITPMVHQKAQGVLPSVYKGRLTDGREAGATDGMSVSGYSDAFVLDSMKAGNPGKSAGVPGFEFVSESQLDFEHYKNRPEFAEEHGQGELFGTNNDIARPGTPGSMGGDSDYSRSGTPVGGPLVGGMTGPARPARTSTNMGLSSGRNSPGPRVPFGQSRSPLYGNPDGNESNTALVQDAEGMGAGTPYHGARQRDYSVDSYHRNAHTPGPSVGALGGGPGGYSGLAQAEHDTPPETQDPAQYDYFRGARRNTRSPGSGF